MSFIGLNRYKISLFFLTWRRQLAAKRMSWMRGPAGVAGGGWFSFSLSQPNLTGLGFSSTDKVGILTGSVPPKLL